LIDKLSKFIEEKQNLNIDNQSENKSAKKNGSFMIEAKNSL